MSIELLDAGAARVVDPLADCGPAASGLASGALDAEHLGAKAASLLELRRDGLPVPAFFCVTTHVWEELFERLGDDLRAALVEPPASRHELEALSSRVREEVLAAGLPEQARCALLSAYDRVFDGGQLVSVRSSALGEDSVSHSFAGQFDSYLCVTRELLAERVLDCIASSCSARALFYRKLHGLGLEATRMGVVVQEMVPSRAAGVAFTLDPREHERDRYREAERVTIVAGLGLGCGVVDGRVPVDTYVLDWDGCLLERRLERKDTRVEHDRQRGHGVVLAEVDATHAVAPALSDEQAREIALAATVLAARRGRPQDIEWALRDTGDLVLLQARPITQTADREQVFDNSNLVESFPGLTTPLTFSLMRRAYRMNFLGLVAAFGAPDKLVAANADVFENLVGLLDGRMYYNLSNWYRMFLQVPGVERALPAFEQAMGFTPATSPRPQRTLISRLRWLPLQLRIVSRLVRAWATLPTRVRAYEASCERCIDELASEDTASLDAHELLERVERYSRELFWKMSAAPISDFFTQQLYGLLGRLIERFELGEQVALRNELLCGETGMKSVEPVRSLVRLAERIGREAPVRQLFESDSDSRTVLRTLHEDASLAGFHRAFELHVQRYGDRSLGELKLETVTLAEDPTDLVAVLRNYLRGERTVGQMQQRERRIRNDAEAHVRARLRRRPLRRALFAFVLARCRRGLKARESMRFTRGRMAGLFRRLYRLLGERFVEQGLLDDSRDLLLLTESEVADAVRGAAVTCELRALVELRRGERSAAERALAEQVASERGGAAQRIETRGIVLANELSPAAAAAAAGGTPAANARRLVGVGCSPGVVRGAARIVRTPSAGMTLNGEILVAETTDPGWVFLMVAAGGLVCERGNVLSHTAIIGRELGIPTIVGVSGAIGAIPEGALLELDGTTGTVLLAAEA